VFPIIACAATVAFLMPILTSLSVAGGVAESPSPFAGFAPGREGKEQQKDGRDVLDAAADEPRAPPRTVYSAKNKRASNTRSLVNAVLCSLRSRLMLLTEDYASGRKTMHTTVSAFND
jgi:hypothetical protein